MSNAQDEQLTEQEAIAFYKSEVWLDWSPYEIARFQLFQDRLCVPFDTFHSALEDALDRPVMTHEFALNMDGIRQEFLGMKQTPSLQEVIDLIPPEKRIVIFADGDA